MFIFYKSIILNILHSGSRILVRSLFRTFHLLFRQIFLTILLSISFYSYALTVKTSNIIHGNAPYLTFDGGHTRAISTDSLLGITLSDGTQYTPSTKPSSITPIELPAVDQSFADIGMFVPTDIDSVELSTLIGSPYNYEEDDDGDGDFSVTGSLSLSIWDKNYKYVSRNAMVDICKAPYYIRLSTTGGKLATQYGIPNSIKFGAGDVIYMINPKNAVPKLCYARPNLAPGDMDENYSHDFRGPATMWSPSDGFLPQSSYDLNFPTAGAHGLYFDLDIGGGGEDLSWEQVSQGGITATMTKSPVTSGVRVKLTGPFATESQWNLDNPERIATPVLPQTFELIGRDSNGNAVVKYGFVLKQWFVSRGTNSYTYPSTLSWCNSLGYRVPKVKDLTNASCQGSNSRTECDGSVGATPFSPDNFHQRHIGAGFFSEWSDLSRYSGASFDYGEVWTSDANGSNRFTVNSILGSVYGSEYSGDPNNRGICVWP
ncbi:hypothetical protein A9G08_08220 [Gilliamella sp. wkB195]|nr:hypothetical protein A9G08_08220 [Gilliamella apicola]